MKKFWAVAVASLTLALAAGGLTAWSLNQQADLRRQLADTRQTADVAGDDARAALDRVASTQADLSELTTSTADGLAEVRRDLAEVKPTYSLTGRNLDELDDDLSKAETNVRNMQGELSLQETRLRSLCTTIRLRTDLFVSC